MGRLRGDSGGGGSDPSERKEEGSNRPPPQGITQSVDTWQLGPFSLGVLVRFSGSTWGSIPGRRRELWNLHFDSCPRPFDALIPGRELIWERMGCGPNVWLCRSSLQH